MNKSHELDYCVKKLILRRYDGSLMKAVKETGVDKAYLFRLRNGTKTNPSKKTLDMLGLEKVVSYRFKQANPQP